MTDWGGERWIKIFKHEAGPWEMLSFEARGAYRLMQSEASAAGEIEVGRHGSGWLAIRFRIDPAVAAEILRELVADGYLRLNDGQWVLPHHAAQQVSRTTPAERQRQTREARKSSKPLEASRDVTRSDNESHVVTLSHEREKEREKETNKAREQESRRAGAREAAAPATAIFEIPVTAEATKAVEATPRLTGMETGPTVRDLAIRLEVPEAQAREIMSARGLRGGNVQRDPMAIEIAAALKASPRFANMADDVAEALLGTLGLTAFDLTPLKIGEAIASAALELEDGATERRARQVLGWKFKDALSPQPQRGNGKSKHLVQGDPNMKQFIKNVSAGRPSWDNGDGAAS